MKLDEWRAEEEEEANIGVGRRDGSMKEKRDQLVENKLDSPGKKSLG